MNCFHLSNITVWILIIVIHLNMLSVTSKLVSIQKGDPNEWREHGEKANMLKFNNIYAISINEELLTESGYSSGRCDQLMSSRVSVAADLPYPNKCPGIIHYCWLKAESERRKAAVNKRDEYHDKCLWSDCGKDGEDSWVHAGVNSMYVGNDCFCVCESYYNVENNPRGDLLDSICYDPVSVDDGYVATGVRFKRHSNILYLELQQGLLSAGRIDPNTLTWKSSDKCSSAKKIVYNWSSNYSAIEVILEDMTLPENAVVTGITFGQSLRGRYVNDNGDFDDNVDDIVKESQCPGSVPELTTNSWSYLSPTSLVGKNIELSKSCQHKIIFRGSDEGMGYMQHVVPYIDLQEIVTDQDSPEPLRGIGWYYRSHSGYGGFLALKIFK